MIRLLLKQGGAARPRGPRGNSDAALETREAQEAARKLALELHVAGAANVQEIDAAIASLVQIEA